MNKILESFTILKIIHQHPHYTPYEVCQVVSKTGLSISDSMVYNMILQLLRAKLVAATGMRYCSHGITPKRKRSSKELEITSEGVKQMFRNECIINICMSLELAGRKL